MHLTTVWQQSIASVQLAVSLAFFVVVFFLCTCWLIDTVLGHGLVFFEP